MRVRLQDDEEDEANGTEQAVENEHDQQRRFQHQVAFDTEEMPQEVVEAEHEDDGDFHTEGIAGVREMIVFEDETENFEDEPERGVEKIGMQKYVEGSTGLISHSEKHVLGSRASGSSRANLTMS